MKKTKIEWCDATWNPVTGCRHGCEYCYARRIAERFGKMMPDHSPYPRDNAGIHMVDSQFIKNPYPFLFEPTFHAYRLSEPARWTKPRTIFVCSMADLFGDWVPDKWIAEVFAACKRAPQHRYLFLTKNPARYLALAASEVGLPKDENMWYGSTATTQDTKTFYSYWHRTFVSIEPMLGPFEYPSSGLPGDDWIIVGAMTGPRAKEHAPKPEWIDGLCKAADRDGTPVFMKNSLVPIIGEENMRRDYPWGVASHE